MVEINSTKKRCDGDGSAVADVDIFSRTCMNAFARDSRTRKPIHTRPCVYAHTTKKHTARSSRKHIVLHTKSFFDGTQLKETIKCFPSYSHSLSLCVCVWNLSFSMHTYMRVPPNTPSQTQTQTRIQLHARKQSHEILVCKQISPE